MPRLHGKAPQSALCTEELAEAAANAESKADDEEDDNEFRRGATK